MKRATHMLPAIAVATSLLALTLPATRVVAQVTAPALDTARVSVVVRDAGPGIVGRQLAYALTRPHVTILPGPTQAIVPKGSTWTTTVVLDRDLVIEGSVHGDVYVVNGNAFVHPGAHVQGRVVAIGGGAYPSMLAIVEGGLVSYRDFTFRVTPDGVTYALDYEAIRRAPSPTFSLPGIYGLRIPTYDRTNGLSLPVAPLISLDTATWEIEPQVTYRSQLGAWDPSVSIRLQPGRRSGADLWVGRTTTTNDAWIWGDLVNSASALFVGIDTRNYYRTDRAQLRVHRLFETPSAEIEPYLGARVEESRAARPAPGATSAPWSMFARGKADRMLRPNPQIPTDRLESALAGLRLSWGATAVHLDATIDEEIGAPRGAGMFYQTTGDAVLAFPTYAGQRYQLNTHVVLTAGDTAPMERWAYLGGSGTLPLIPLLSLGGDHLLYVENQYFVPLNWINLPIVGPPRITLRHILAGADVGRFPTLEQNLGARVGVGPIRFDLLLDPTQRRASTGIGFSFTR